MNSRSVLSLFFILFQTASLSGYIFSTGGVTSFTKINTVPGYAINSGDYFGSSLSVSKDIDGDGISDVIVGDFDNGIGGLYVNFMNDDGTIRTSQKISSTLGGFAGDIVSGDNFAVSLSSFSDLDGDGIPDIAAGSFYDDDGGSNSGAVYIIFLNRDGTVKDFQKISRLHGGLTGVSTGDTFGYCVTTLPDLDGDGIEDLAVGAPGTGIGTVHILFLNRNGTIKNSQKISNTEGNMGYDFSLGSEFGSSISSFDFDGDEIPDLLVGYPSANSYRGGYFILLLNRDGTVKDYVVVPASALPTVSFASNTWLGFSVSALPDMDGDMVPEILLGSPYYSSSRGGAFLVYLNRDGTPKSIVDYSNSNPMVSLSSNVQYGYDVNYFEDLGGKFIFVVGAPSTDSTAGAIHFLEISQEVTDCFYLQNPSPMCELSEEKMETNSSAVKFLNMTVSYTNNSTISNSTVQISESALSFTENLVVKESTFFVDKSDISASDIFFTDSVFDVNLPANISVLNTLTVSNTKLRVSLKSSQLENRTKTIMKVSKRNTIGAFTEVEIRIDEQQNNDYELEYRDNSIIIKETDNIIPTTVPTSSEHSIEFESSISSSTSSSTSSTSIEVFTDDTTSSGTDEVIDTAPESNDVVIIILILIIVLLLIIIAVLVISNYTKIGDLLFFNKL
eukprot:TRINITY_DN3836_c0_g1_i1.p1 TRINITY_DN3836_c0_g1~~TRINITY_DN3836_c0_g1_i1.p1  ORF type:complete len:673 (-),score=133.56 TRINITY_DN3836_c0_g1_i1:16-2034(-)